MKQFLAGFSIAALLGTGMLYGQANGYVTVFAPPAPEPVEAPPVVTIEADTDTSGEKKKRRKGKRRAGSGNKAETGSVNRVEGDGEVGDALLSRDREVDGGVAGGEQQLTATQIEAGIDRGFAGIERCLMLMPPDAPSKGRVVVGMNIAPSGQVTRVNLKGTNTMITGECGACIQRIVRSLKFPSFNGSEMTAHYPIDFD